MSDDNYFMQEALDIAKQASKDVPVGAVIVKNKKIIAAFHNEKEIRNDVTAHAEILCLKKASEVLQNWRLKDCILYVTLEPCPMCASAIINSQISKVVFGSFDLLYGAFGSKINLPSVFNSKIKIKGGILQKECDKLLEEFWNNNVRA
jgi:tRNA(adenine34) deaminase